MSLGYLQIFLNNTARQSTIQERLYKIVRGLLMELW